MCGKQHLTVCHTEVDVKSQRHNIQGSDIWLESGKGAASYISCTPADGTTITASTFPSAESKLVVHVSPKDGFFGTLNVIRGELRA